MRPTRQAALRSSVTSNANGFAAAVNEAPNPIGVVIAHEYAASRGAVRKLLDGQHGVRILGEAADSSEVLCLICQLEPDVVILDLELCRAFEASVVSNFAARVVVVIQEIDKAQVVDAFLHGAHAVVLITDSSAALLRSLRSVMAGHYWLESETLGALVEAVRELSSRGNGARSPKDYGLTPREMEIIAKVASGFSNKELSREFSISERTVKHHLTNIFEKVGVSSRLELALFAVNRRCWKEESGAPSLLPRAKPN